MSFFCLTRFFLKLYFVFHCFRDTLLFVSTISIVFYVPVTYLKVAGRLPYFSKAISPL